MFLKKITRPGAWAVLGLSLALGACGDDDVKADADPIKTGFVAALEQAATAQGATFTHGEATIAEDDGSLLLTIPGIKLSFKDAEPVGLSELKFRFTKDDGAYKFAALDLPKNLPATIVSQTGEKSQLSIDGLQVDGSWLVAEKRHKALGIAWTKISGTTIDQYGATSPLTIEKGGYKSERKAIDDKHADETVTLAADSITVGNPTAPQAGQPTVIITAPQFSAVSNNVNYEKYEAFTQMAQQIEAGKAQPSQLPPFDFLSSGSFDYQDKGWRILSETGQGDAWQSKGTTAKIGFRDLDKPVSVIDFNLNFAQLSLPEIESILDAQSKTYLPKDINLAFALENVNMNAVLQKAMQSTQQSATLGADPESMAMVLGQSIIEDFTKSGGRIVFKDTSLIAEAAKIYLNGQLQPTDKSPVGLTAMLKLDVVGLDKIVALAEKDPTLQAFLDVGLLKALQSVGTKVDVKGDAAHHFDLNLPEDGNATINGQPVQQVLGQ